MYPLGNVVERSRARCRSHPGICAALLCYVFRGTCVVLTMTAVCMLRILFTCSFSGTSPFCLEPTPLGYREERLWCWRHGQTRVCPATRVSLQDRSQVQEVLPSTYEMDCESCVRYCSFDRSSVLHHTPVLSRGGAVIFQGSVARALHLSVHTDCEQLSSQCFPRANSHSSACGWTAKHCMTIASTTLDHLDSWSQSCPKRRRMSQKLLTAKLELIQYGPSVCFPN